jgi:O-antigen ligase
MERPIFGLAFSSGESAWASQDIAVGGADPHNVFLKWLWIGGLSYFLPWLALTCVSAWSAIRVWTARQYYQRRELVTIMVLLLFAMYLHGLTSPVIITSNHFLAFLHVFLAMLFINWASDVSQDIAVHNGAILE